MNALAHSQVSQEFLQLVFQLRDLSLPQLKTLWEEASFKCRNDWSVFSRPRAPRQSSRSRPPQAAVAGGVTGLRVRELRCAPVQPVEGWGGGGGAGRSFPGFRGPHPSPDPADRRGRQRKGRLNRNALNVVLRTLPNPLSQVLLELPELRHKALLSGSSLVYQLCQRSRTSCGEVPQVQTFVNKLEEILKGGTTGDPPTQGQAVGGETERLGNSGVRP